MINLFHLPISDHPDAPQWQARVATIERLIPRLSGEAADKLQRERHSLLRRIHDIPLGILLPTW